MSWLLLSAEKALAKDFEKFQKIVILLWPYDEYFKDRESKEAIKTANGSIMYFDLGRISVIAST